MRIRRWTPGLAAGLALTVAMIGHPRPAFAAPPDDVRARARKAAAAIADGRLEEADAMIAANLEANPDPFVYLLGVLREQQGDCPGAVKAYHRYMDLDVADQDVAAAQAGVERCADHDDVRSDGSEQEPAAVAGVDAPRAGGVEEPDGGTAGGPTDGPEPRWWTDPVGLGLGVGGGALLIAGVVTWSQTSAQSRAAEDAGSLSTYERHGRRAEIFQGVGIALVATGAALLVGGAIRYGLVASKRKQRRSVAARIRPAPTGFVLTF